MKNLPACILLLLIACGPKPEADMKGAYSMTSQVINDGTKDSIIDRKQLKIFTDGFMMYASPNVSDSFANFGIGRYAVKDGKLTEYRFYTAVDGEKMDTFELSVEQNMDGFRQVIENLQMEGKTYKLTEDYENASRELASPLDGAWKQVKNIYITAKGDSSVNNNPLEYKAFQSGYFIWAITVRDSLNRRTSVFGYGPFEMVNQNKIRETIVNSTFSTTLGKTYEVDIEFMGKDSYKQTITFANGDKSIEIYERLK
ncbi:MAG TPA: hypothetical protein VD993_13825 [Chitinophagaceae bacterium]|nr:hypothetical protein [Chitinophagaceae bacterium]